MHESVLSKNAARRIQALKLKKTRTESGHFLLEGSKAVLDLLNAPGIKILEIVALPAWIEQHRSILRQGQVASVMSCDEAAMKELTAFATASPVMAIAEKPHFLVPAVLSDWVLYLDAIRDPGNLGTLLRIADWFGLEAVFCSPDCADLYNPKTLQASMSSFLRMPCIEMPFEDFERAYPNFPLVAADMAGKSAYASAFPQAGCLLIGNEGQGLRTELMEAVHQVVSIPGLHSKGAESLNAAVSAGIILGAIRFAK